MLTIEIKGSTKSGKTLVCATIAKALHELGMRVEVDDLDFTSQKPEHWNRLLEDINLHGTHEVRIITTRIRRYNIPSSSTD